MKIEGCGGCGNCAEFVCPEEAFKLNYTAGYATASIDSEKCTDCGLCKLEIECLCEAISE
jgi:ferredoxin